MKTITCIANYKDGDSIQGFYLCVEKHLRHTRSGDLFLDLQLRDRTGSINGKIWDNVDKLNEKFNAGDPVAVSGNVDSFKERPQLIVKKINRASVQYYGRYGYDPSLIVPASSKNPNDMWKVITKIIRSIKSNPLRKLVSMIYRENKDILLVHPASVKMHHNYRSGFIEHVLSMAEIADQLAVHYQLDRDLLIAGVFLHDIGKIIEISSDLEAEYTDEGNFIGHIVISRDIVRSAAKKITNFPEDVQIKLEHMGLYAYTIEALDWFVGNSPGTYEILEGLEQLRFLEHGWKIATVPVAPPEHALSGIDTAADLALAEEAIAKLGDPYPA